MRRSTEHRQCARTSVRARVLAFALFASATGVSAEDFCTNLDAQPPTFAVSYQAIQFIFQENGCTDCHEGHIACDPKGQTAFPSAGMDLCPGISWFSLVRTPSSQDGTLTRVVPNQPQASLLFSKVHCGEPFIGSRMPLGLGQLSDYDQSLIYDWIAGGAPLGTTDTLFRGEFEPRG